MNFRRAATLAIVGWYLMMPPMGSVESRRDPSSGFYVAFSAEPLSAWEIAGSYGSAAACARALDQANQLVRQDCPDCSVVASCIRADDPALKDKDPLQ